MRKILAAATTALLALSFAQGAHAQRRRAGGGGGTEAELRALRGEVEALREGQRAIQAELEEIKKLLRDVAEQGAGRQQQPTVSVDDDPSIGESTAKVVLIDFSDYQ